MALTEVNSLGIKDLEVKTADIAADAVTGAKIADDAIDSEHYTNASIDHAHLANDCVDGDNLADNAVDSEHYTDGSIDTAHIADDQITLAKMASGTDGVIITYDASGNPVHVGPGTDGQVLTSTGAGSPPAFEDASAGATLSGSTDNTVVTVTGANAMQGEAGLIYDGNDLYVKSGEGNDASIHLYSDEGDDNADKWRILNAQSTSNKLRIASYAGGSWADHLNIETAGDLEVVRGNLKFATGKGIDFAATGEGTSGSMQSELFDDYEEGTFTPLLGGSNYGTYNITGTGKYTKIGEMVHVEFKFTNQDLDNSASGQMRVRGWPYAINVTNTRPHCGSLMMAEVTLTTSHDEHTYFLYGEDTASMYGLISRDDANWDGWNVNCFDSSNLYFEGTFSYRV